MCQGGWVLLATRDSQVLCHQNLLTGSMLPASAALEKLSTSRAPLAGVACPQGIGKGSGLSALVFVAVALGTFSVLSSATFSCFLGFVWASSNG